MENQLKHLAECLKEDFYKHQYTATKGNISKVDLIQIDINVIGTLKNDGDKKLTEVEIELALLYRDSKPDRLNVVATKRVNGKVEGTPLNNSFSILNFTLTEEGVLKLWKDKNGTYANGELSETILKNILES